MKTQRFDTLDALRGLTMVWMTVFHGVFDLSHFKLFTQDFYRDPFWTWQRTLIVSLFLLCAGLGQAIATAQGQSWRRFWRRWAQVAGCAVLVTAGSWMGWVSQKPVTEDYVPLFPWLGVMWWGAATGAWILQHQAQWLMQPLPKAVRTLAWLGRWSLSYYTLHQPVLIMGVMGLSQIVRMG